MLGEYRRNRSLATGEVAEHQRCIRVEDVQEEVLARGRA
jgi:hypothetical protein